MPNLGYRVEPAGQKSGVCTCCGNQSKTLWGYLYRDDQALACYFIQWTPAASLRVHPANFDLIIGRWDAGSGPSDRVAVSLIQFENDAGQSAMVIDAAGRPTSNGRLASKALQRAEVIGTPLASEIFAIFDAILVLEKRLVS